VQCRLCSPLVQRCNAMPAAGARQLIRSRHVDMSYSCPRCGHARQRGQGSSVGGRCWPGWRAEARESRGQGDSGAGEILADEGACARPRPLAVCATTAGGPVAGQVPAHPDAPGVGVSRPRGGGGPLGGEATRYAYVRYNSHGSQDRSGHGHTLAAASVALLMRAVHTACTGKHAIDAVR